MLSTLAHFGNIPGCSQ